MKFFLAIGGKVSSTFWFQKQAKEQHFIFPILRAVFELFEFFRDFLGVILKANFEEKIAEYLPAPIEGGAWAKINPWVGNRIKKKVEIETRLKLLVKFISREQQLFFSQQTTVIIYWLQFVKNRLFFRKSFR